MKKGFYKANNFTRQIVYKSKQELHKMLVLEALESIEKYQRAKNDVPGEVITSRREIGEVITNRLPEGELSEKNIRTALEQLKKEGHIHIKGRHENKKIIYELVVLTESNGKQESDVINGLIEVDGKRKEEDTKNGKTNGKTKHCNINDFSDQTAKQTANNNKNYNKNNIYINNNININNTIII